jgi:hypothetical protein
MNDPYRPPAADLEEKKAPSAPTSPQLKGIGGWLILVVLGLVVSPLRTAYLLITTHWPIFRDGTWAILTTPGTGSYHPLWAPLITLEILGNLGSIALALVALWSLVRKSRRTPIFVIAWLSWTTALVAADFFAADMIPAVAAQADHDSVKELGRTIFGACIWIPYFLVSKRVKATFVE